MKKGIMTVVIVVVVAVLIFLGDYSKIRRYSKKNSDSTTSVSSVEKSESTDDSIVYEDYGKVKVLDTDCLAIYTTYTNNTGKNTIPADDVTVSAFQNGIELSPMVPTGEETNGYIQCDTTVQTGATAKVVWIFKVNDSSKVTVKFPNGTSKELSIDK